MTLSVETFATVIGVLQKELAEVTIDPKQEYHLNWEHHTPREYQKLLFRAREEVQAFLENEGNDEDIPGDDDDYQKVNAFNLVFYIISEIASGEDDKLEKELGIYETPFFVTKNECVEYAVKNTPAVAWELFCYADENPVNDYKQDYLDTAWTKHAESTTAIQQWLRLGLFDPETLMSEDQSNYCGHSKITEPKFNINAYARWETAALLLRKEDA